MKRIITGLLGIFIVAAVSGCTYVQNKLQDDSNMTHQERICANLKRKIIFSHSDLNMNTKLRTPTQKARLMQQYRENGCESLEKAK